MSAAHTPGPWIADYVGVAKAVLIGTADRQTAFARMEAHDGEPNDETQEANARLIVSAPELLEAVQDLVALIGEVAPACWESPMMEYARAAIAKSTGENS